jgi:hypothetical protein
LDVISNMGKSQIVFLTLIVFISCGSPENSKEQNIEQLIETNEQVVSTPISETREVIDSTTTNTQTRETKQLNFFAGTTYFLTSDYDLDNCENLSRCDCCTSELVFFEESRYAYMFVCEANSTFLKGTYSTDSNRLTLNHDSLVVSDVQPMFGDELEDDFDSTQYGVFAQEQYIKPLEFTISKCGERTLISMINNSNKDHGTEGTRTSYLKSILANQTSEIAEKLNVE